MAMTLTITGMDEISAMLNECADKAQDVAACALYEGAGCVADSIGQSINGIVTEPFDYVFKPDSGYCRYPSPEEKAVLTNAGSYGIATFRKNGSEVETIVGMANSGYGTIKGREVPVPLIARAIESGTSFMVKQPFMRRAIMQSKAKASKRIIDEIDKRFQEIINKA